MAIGSVTGALLAARRERPRLAMALAGAGVFGLGLSVAALMPNAALFGLCLIAVGMAAQTFNVTINSTVQLTTEPAMRGRVMAILLALALGGTPIGAPIAGWIADTFGPRWALGLGAAAGFAALAVGLHYLVKYRGLRLSMVAGRPRLELPLPVAPVQVVMPAPARPAAAE